MKISILTVLLILFSSLAVACGTDKDINAYNQIISTTTVTSKSTPDPLAYTKEKTDGGNDESDVSNRTDYKIVTDIYTNNNIKIQYPQINNLIDNVKQNKINQIIKDNAYGYLKDFSQEEINSLSWDINYRITWKSKNLMSIQYSGYSYYEGAAHPVDQFYTTNIDM
ncbi:PdaC/SigV domain-containing protein, partial [Paenibacillus alba]